MAIYKDNTKVNKFEVGKYSTANVFWWAKDKTLLSVSLENVRQIEKFNLFNKFEDIKLFIRSPLKSEKNLFSNSKNVKIGRANNEKELKRLILNYEYSYDTKIKKEQ